MKHTSPPFLALALIGCLVSSATAQRSLGPNPSRRSSQPIPQVQVGRPAIIVISDRPLLNYATRRSNDLFTVTIYEVGNFKTISGGQPFEQQQPTGSNELVISFQLQPRTNPQIEQAGNQLSFYFESVSLPASGISASALTPTRTPVGPSTRPPVQRAPVTAPFAPSVDATQPIVAMAELDVKNYINPDTESGTCSDIEEPGKDVIQISESSGKSQPRAVTDSKQELVIIDANTGKILEGATHVSENTRIKVVFVNKNPFKYDYSFQLIPKDVGNTTVISFLNLIPGIPGIPGVLEGISRQLHRN